MYISQSAEDGLGKTEGETLIFEGHFSVSSGASSLSIPAPGLRPELPLVVHVRLRRCARSKGLRLCTLEQLPLVTEQHIACACRCSVDRLGSLQACVTQPNAVVRGLANGSRDCIDFAARTSANARILPCILRL